MDLHSFALTVRRIIFYTVVGAIAVVLLILLYRGAVSLYLTINPPPESPPTVGFGKLPSLRLASLEIQGSPTFQLETPTGELTTFDDRSNVVKMEEIQPTPLGEEKARNLAQRLDFGGQGTLSADREILTFQDALDERTLRVNVVNQNFTLTTSVNRISQIPKGRAPSGLQAIEETKDTLNRLGLLKFGFEEGNQKTTFMAASGGELVFAGSVSEAQLTQVDFFRSLTGVGSQSYPIVPKNPKEGLIQVQVTTDLKPEILNTLAITYNAQGSGINKEQVESYPLKDVAAAWEEVQAGQGVAYIGISGEVQEVAITEVSLAYFDDPIHQDYLQPIYVFSGVARGSGGREGEFEAYSQAVDPSWIE